MSNENEVFANAIINCDLFKFSKRSSVVDIGTGDGDVISRIIRNKKDNKYILVDPSDDYLSIARDINRENLSIISFEKHKFIDMALYPDSIYLATHMVYLLTPNEIELLLDLPNKGHELILIVDAPGSLFSQLWKLFAKEYFEKCEFFYTLLKKIKYRKIKMTAISTEVLSPFKARIDNFIRVAMLSTMCYCEWAKLSSEQQNQAKSLITKYNPGDRIRCISNLIEIGPNR